MLEALNAVFGLTLYQMTASTDFRKTQTTQNYAIKSFQASLCNFIDNETFNPADCRSLLSSLCPWLWPGCVYIFSECSTGKGI